MQGQGVGSRGRGIALVLFLLAAGLLTIPGLRGCRDRPVLPVAERGAAQTLALTTIDAQPWRLTDYRGRVVVVNFWATWCGPCRAETPALVTISQELAGRGLRVVGVSLDAGPDRVERVRQFAAVYGVTYPLAMPDPLTQLDQAIEAVPTTLLFDRQGRLALTYVGAVSERVFRRDTAVLLAER